MVPTRRPCVCWNLIFTDKSMSLSLNVVILIITITIIFVFNSFSANNIALILHGTSIENKFKLQIIDLPIVTTNNCCWIQNSNNVIH